MNSIHPLPLTIFDYIGKVVITLAEVFFMAQYLLSSGSYSPRVQIVVRTKTWTIDRQIFDRHKTIDRHNTDSKMTNTEKLSPSQPVLGWVTCK